MTMVTEGGRQTSDLGLQTSGSYIVLYRLDYECVGTELVRSFICG